MKNSKYNNDDDNNNNNNNNHTLKCLSKDLYLLQPAFYVFINIVIMYKQNKIIQSKYKVDNSVKQTKQKINSPLKKLRLDCTYANIDYFSAWH